MCYIGDPVRVSLIIEGMCILGCEEFIPVTLSKPEVDSAAGLNRTLKSLPSGEDDLLDGFKC